MRSGVFPQDMHRWRPEPLTIRPSAPFSPASGQEGRWDFPLPQSLAPAHPLARTVRALLPSSTPGPPPGEVRLEPLPSSRPVYRFSSPQGQAQAVGKFFSGYPPLSSADWGLMREHHHYLQAEALGLVNGSRLIPRLLGRRPRMRLGLLLEDIPGPDLDHLLARACGQDEADPLYRGLEKLARLLAFFHTRPLQAAPASPFPALAYFAKLRRQLGELKLLSPEDEEALDTERWAWEARLTELPDCLVLVHGDATPTNFLFPDGRAVAIDLERLGAGDRLWDLSWVAGELKHAWGWRTGQMDRAEPFIRHFFAAYLAALPRDRGPAFRVRRLNPFYMALAELRIARNAYLTWDYRLALIKEARRCLFYGRRF